MLTLVMVGNIRWTNANTEISETLNLGIIPSGGFYIIANDAAKFSSTYSFDPNQEDTANEAAVNSNGDDNIALVNSERPLICLASWD